MHACNSAFQVHEINRREAALTRHQRNVEERRQRKDDKTGASQQCCDITVETKPKVKLID